MKIWLIKTESFNCPYMKSNAYGVDKCLLPKNESELCLIYKCLIKCEVL